MADNHHKIDDHATGGTMDITEHVKMWNAFWNVSKWGCVALLVLAALLAIFRTHNGY